MTGNDSRIIASDDAMEPAWNAMAGVVLPIVDHVDLTAGYRYLGSLDPRLEGRVVDLVTGDVTTFEADASNHIHELLIGVRLTF